MSVDQMYEVSIFWEHDSDELREMMDALGWPGETVGNDGCQIVVDGDEMRAIREYAAAHPNEIHLEESGGISREKAEARARRWREGGEA